MVTLLLASGTTRVVILPGLIFGSAIETAVVILVSLRRLRK